MPEWFVEGELPTTAEFPSSVAQPGQSTDKVREVILTDLWNAVGAELRRGWASQEPPRAVDYAKAVDVVVHLAEANTLDKPAADVIAAVLLATMLHDEIALMVSASSSPWLAAAGRERHG